jgi:hypothetical protein
MGWSRKWFWERDETHSDMKMFPSTHFLCGDTALFFDRPSSVAPPRQSNFQPFPYIPYHHTTPTFQCSKCRGYSVDSITSQKKGIISISEYSEFEVLTIFLVSQQLRTHHRNRPSRRHGLNLPCSAMASAGLVLAAGAAR